MDLILELLSKIGWINVVEITVIILLEVFYFYLSLSLAVLEGIAISINPDYKVLGSTYPWIARKVLTDSSPQLKSSLQNLLYEVKTDIFFLFVMHSFNYGTHYIEAIDAVVCALNLQAKRHYTYVVNHSLDP